jgi:protein-disulfide isomerase-like protein with CxxC motif
LGTPSNGKWRSAASSWASAWAISQDADYIRRNAPSAERASGLRSGTAYWRDLVAPGTWVHDSAPPVRAVATRDLAGDSAAVYVHQALCHGMFVHGLAPGDPAQVHAVTAALGGRGGHRRALAVAGGARGGLN